MDPTRKLPPNPFINNTQKKYYNVCKQRFNLPTPNNGEVTYLNRKWETQGGITNTKDIVGVYLSEAELN